jgi:hypothetical protein
MIGNDVRRYDQKVNNRAIAALERIWIRPSGLHAVTDNKTRTLLFRCMKRLPEKQGLQELTTNI